MLSWVALEDRNPPWIDLAPPFSPVNRHTVRMTNIESAITGLSQKVTELACGLQQQPVVEEEGPEAVLEEGAPEEDV